MLIFVDDLISNSVTVKSFAVLIPDVAGVDLSVSESRMIHLEMGSTPCRHYSDMSVYFDCTKNYFKWAIF